MKEYNDVTIYEELQALFDKRIEWIKPIGNHDLKRHLVYLVRFDNEDIIMKLYYKKGRRSREIESLKTIEASSIKAPTIINFGELEDGTEYLMINRFRGEPFSKVHHLMNKANRVELFEAMGETLSELHSMTTFDFYGEWECRDVTDNKNYLHALTPKIEIFKRMIQKCDTPQKEFLLRCCNDVDEEMASFECPEWSRLTHLDFNTRNVLVDFDNGKWQFKALIDFEQSMPWNYEEDIASVYNRYLIENEDYHQAFLKGYSKHMTLDKGFYQRLRFYNLIEGLNACSWAYENAKDYYYYGIELLNRYQKMKEES